MNQQSENELVGVVHVHSIYSDGSGSVADILAVARAAELDFVVLSDHDTLAARREGWEGAHDGVTLVVGDEISPRGAPHVLALAVKDSLGFAQMPSKEYLDRILRAGGFAVVAHPEGTNKPDFGIKHVRWLSWSHPAIRAVEIWNYQHDWMEGLHVWSVHKFHRFFTQPHLQIAGPRQRVLASWDRQAQRRKLSGVGGLDCHALRVPLSNMEVFPYAYMFRTVRTHVLVQGDRRDVPAVLEAMREARCFVAQDWLADSRGARFWAECECGARLSIGEEHRCSRKATLQLHLPREADIRLISNGTVVSQAAGKSLHATVASPAICRAEVFLRGRPWIFTNHIYLRGARAEP